MCWIRISLFLGNTHQSIRAKGHEVLTERAHAKTQMTDQTGQNINRWIYMKDIWAFYSCNFSLSLKLLPNKSNFKKGNRIQQWPSAFMLWTLPRFWDPGVCSSQSSFRWFQCADKGGTATQPESSSIKSRHKKWLFCPLKNKHWGTESQVLQTPSPPLKGRSCAFTRQAERNE